jgi:hypothetical protein
VPYPASLKRKGVVKEGWLFSPECRCRSAAGPKCPSPDRKVPDELRV